MSSRPRPMMGGAATCLATASIGGTGELRTRSSHPPHKIGLLPHNPTRPTGPRPARAHSLDNGSARARLEIMSNRGPILGVDLGEKRIGLAVSDPAASIAFPAGFVASRGRARDLAALRKVIEERGIVRVVVGLPIHLDGKASPGSVAARSFADALGEATGLPVDLLDERWTSRAAERSLRETRGGRKKRREAVDAVAATILLRTYLERQLASKVPRE
jgi:putative Holliday junction resolvase